MTTLSKALASPIKFYQRWVSPLFGRRCRYYPTCSEYAVTALHRHGALKGLLLGIWRLLRCNPITDGGVDHVPEKGKWKRPAYVRPTE